MKIRTTQTIDYEFELMSNDTYNISRSLNGGRFKFCFGGVKQDELEFYKKDPNQIEIKRKQLRGILYFIIIPIILISIHFI